MSFPRPTSPILLVTGLAGAAVVASVVYLTTRAPSGEDANPPSAAPASKSATVDLKILQKAIESAADCINANRLSEAESLLVDLEKRYPKERIVWEHSLELMLFQGRFEDAYRKALRLCELAPDDPEVRFNAAVIADDINRFDEAVGHLTRAKQVAPANPKYPLTLAQIQIKRHEYEAAKVELLKVLALDPSIHQAVGTLAEVYLLENNVELAAQQIARARELAPDVLKYRLVQAKVLRRQNRPEDALTLLNALPPDQRSRADVVEAVAFCHAQMGRPELAAQEHLKFLNRNPAAWPHALAAAEFFRVAGDENSANHWLGYARRVSPNAPEIDRFAKRLESFTSATSDDSQAAAEPPADP